MKRSKLLTIGMLVIFLGLAGQVWGTAGRPNNVYRTDSIVVDGNLGEWANTEWAPLDQLTYAGTPTIIQAFYSIAWSDTKNKLYVAIKVQDTNHVTKNNPYVYNVMDCVEVYVHTTGNYVCPPGVTGTGYQEFQAAAQEYCFWLQDNGTTASVFSGNNAPIPADCGFVCAAHEGVNNWLYYECEFVPWIFCGTLVGDPKPPVTQTDLAPGVSVGVDVDFIDVDRVGGVVTPQGFVTENLLGGKYNNYNQIATHVLSGTALVIPSPIPTIDPTPTPTITPTPAPGTAAFAQGTIILSDYDPVDYNVAVGFELVLFDDEWNILYSDNLIKIGTLTALNESESYWGAQFSISPIVTAGTYNLAIKSYGHCSTVVPCAIDGATTTELGNILLRAADVHGDNEVFFTPLSIVLKYFGTSGDGDPF